MTESGVRIRVLNSTRLLVAFVAISALVAGYIGLDRFIQQTNAQFGGGFWDIAYYDLQLFVLGSDPLSLPGPYPVELAVARFAAPAASLYALYEAGRAIFAGQIRRWRSRNRRHHAIVTGDTTAARAFVSHLRGAGQIVVALPGPSTVDELRLAGVAGARAVYACADDSQESTTNVATAQAALSVPRRSRRVKPLRIYAHVGDPVLALGLRARWLGMPDKDKPLVDYFNVDEIAARACLRPTDFEVAVGESPHILIAGLGAFGKALLTEFARQWQVRSELIGQRVKVTLVGADQADVDAVRDTWSLVTDVCDIELAGNDLDAALNSMAALPHRTFVCYDDEDLALRTALTGARLWRGGFGSVIVRLNELSRHAAFHTASKANLLGDVGGHLRLVNVSSYACREDAVGEDLVELLAQSIHRRYVVDQRSRGEADRTALKPWQELPEPVRVPNRALARDIGRKLNLIGATVAPRIGRGESFAFTESELGRLSEHEHERWMDERRESGWRYGPIRDDVAKRHPSIRPWSELSEVEQDKDRTAVLGLAAVLDDVGLRIVRLTDSVPSPRSPIF